jgi:hypothetical protein
MRTSCSTRAWTWTWPVNGPSTTFRQAIEQLDARRDGDAVELAYNNFLFYLVKAGHVAEALRRCSVLPRPRQERYLANRLSVEGCIHLALGHLQIAGEWLEESADLFTKLGKPGDAMIAILYLASVRAMSGDHHGARDHLAAAESIGHSGGYSVALSLQRLVRYADQATDLPLEIMNVAFEAGGCLGPPQAETPGT